MLQFSTHKIGDVTINIYDFPEVGDELETHFHTASSRTGHFTVVARGEVLAFGDGWEKPAKAGDVIDLADDENHGFRALVAGSRIVNVPKWSTLIASV